MRELLLPEAGFCLKNKDNVLFAVSGQLFITSVVPSPPLFSIPPYGIIPLFQFVSSYELFCII